MTRPLTERACAKASRLVSAAQDRPLLLTERISLRVHLAICDGCTNYAKQVQFMRQAMGRWSNYAGDDGAP